MTHRVYVIWSGHRKGQRTRRKLPGLRRGEWAYGDGAELGREVALGVAASIKSRGHKARVVDGAGAEVVIKPKLHPLRAAIQARMAKVAVAEERAKNPAPNPQALLFWGAR